MSRYTFSEPDETWNLQFAEEADRLEQLLSEWLQTVHHIGSTAVPGLAAKPIIDLLPVVHDATLLDRLHPRLEAAGYVGRGELGLPGRRFFCKDRDGTRTHNLHFYGVGHPDIERHLAFRDFLVAHPGVARDYEGLKRAAFAKFPEEIDAYNDFKGAWIKAVEPIATRWWRDVPHLEFAD